jgi:protease-4
MSRALAVTVFGLLVVSFAPLARAQVPDPEARPTRGVHVAGATRAGDADATSLSSNPAQLGLLPAGGLALAQDYGARGALLAGRGSALFLGGPALHGGLALSLAYVGDSEAWGVERHGIFALGYALRFGDATAFGASWTHVWGSRWGGTDTFDLGLSRRFGRWAAVGLVVEDVGEPTSSASSARAGATLPRLWAGELVARPLGTDRLELAVGASHVEGEPWRWLVPRARLGARLASGLRAFAAAATLPRGSQLALASGADYQAELGLAFDLDHFGVTASGRAAFPGAGGGDAAGDGALVLRFEGLRRAPLVARANVVRVRLEHLESDRAYVATVRRLRALAGDPNAAAVVLHVETEGLGLGRVEELRDLVAGLRARGKKVFAYGAFPATRDYYLATACDAIFMHPAGALALTGFAQSVTFYKRALDTLGVHVDLVRIAEYKGAMEPFVFEEQTAPVKANRNDLLDDVFRRLLATLARARAASGPRDEAAARALVDRGLFTPEEARAAGLVDAVADDDELEKVLARALGRDQVAIRDADAAPLDEAWPSRRVAVVFAEGTIVDGASHRLFGGAVAGSDSIVAALEACRQDGSVRAVVLRVNSPGGSAYASDVIAREIVKVRKAGKPVIVSMGDIAASGGYYIAAPGDAIFAEPSTLSGSIGIFSYKVDAQKLLGTLGVGVETYRRGEHADYMSPFRPWTPAEVKIAQEKIRHLYDLFLTTIVDGRKSHGLDTRDKVDALGRGHIWTGAEAQARGLVDRLGGVSDALDLAATLGHVPTNRDGFPNMTILPPETGGLIGQLRNLGLVASDDDETALHDHLRALAGPALKLLAPLLLNGGEGTLARVPYEIELR